jgi:hypothetical protein
MTVTFQGECPAGFDLIRGGILHDDRHLFSGSL